MYEYYPGMFWKGWGKPRKTSVTVAGIRTEIWTLDFTNTKQECNHPPMTLGTYNILRPQMFLWTLLKPQWNDNLVASDPQQGFVLTVLVFVRVVWYVRWTEKRAPQWSNVRERMCVTWGRISSGFISSWAAFDESRLRFEWWWYLSHITTLLYTLRIVWCYVIVFHRFLKETAEPASLTL
jgi:hypothetical protein